MHETYFNYFAYGSNIHPIRIQERVGTVKFVSIATLQGASLCFNKLSLDGSGKGNLRFEESGNESVIGVLYQLTSSQKKKLDSLESGTFGYDVIKVFVEKDNTPVEAFTYKASKPYVKVNLSPHDWYKNLVLKGAGYYGFPAEYISLIQSVPSIRDNNEDRSARMRKFLNSMK